MRIGERQIGDGSPCFVIAEAGINHNGDLAMAREMVGVAAAAGADAVKFQTFETAKLLTPEAPKADYQLAQTAEDESQFEMLSRVELSREDHCALRSTAAEHGILFMSTPFTESSTDLLDDLGVPVFKIPSGEITNLLYLRHLAAKGRPAIMSTGMATMAEVDTAMTIFLNAGMAERVVLLHCVSNYPADAGNVNLRVLATLAQEFGVPVGLSDHTLGIHIAIAAVALGAAVIEKHFTLDRGLPGADQAASLEPGELTQLVSCIRDVEAAMGDGRKQPAASEAATAAMARKSLAAFRDLASGHTLLAEDIACKRPGTGIPPAALEQVVGRRLTQPLPADTLLQWEQLT